MKLEVSNVTQEGPLVPSWPR